MANLIGAYQYFDDSFLQGSRDYPKPVVPWTTNTSLQSLHGFLAKNHPGWWWVMKNARRADFFQNDPDHRYTMFVPDDDAAVGILSTSDLLNYDVDHCLQLFRQFVIPGDYSLDVLRTSLFQQLNTLAQGFPLLLKNGGMIVQDRFRIDVERSDILLGNVRIHILHRRV